MKHLGFSDVELRTIKPYLTRPVDSSFVNNLAAKIATHNYVAPLGVVKRGSTYLCAGGVHRLLALKKLRRKTAPCCVYKATDEELPVIALLDNDVLPMSRIDKAKIINKMFDEGRSEDEICDDLKISSRQLNSLLVLLNVPEEYRKKIIEYPKRPNPKKPLSSTHVEEIEKLSGKHQARRRSELYAQILDRARKAKVDANVKIFSHREVRRIVKVSNSMPEKSIGSVAAQIERREQLASEVTKKARKVCPTCKGRGYITKG
jgi:ParB-like chromosome segregation protein Spo0J